MSLMAAKEPCRDLKGGSSVESAPKDFLASRATRDGTSPGLSPYAPIEQNLPQPFLMVLFSPSGRYGGTKGQCPLVGELRYNIG